MTRWCFGSRPGAVVDVQVVMKGTWMDAVGLPGLGADLLDGMAVKGAAAFETWLLAQQRHAAAASEAVLHEAALGSMARGALEAAIGYAVRAAAMSPLDENHQALLIRLYRMAGDDDAAAKQFAACAKALRAELGVAPGPAVQAAMRQPRSAPGEVAGDATIEAIVEAGSAAVSAGAVEAGVQSLRTAARLADGAGATRLRVSSRLVLAEALIHALGGLDEEGLATLYEADEIALAHGLLNEVAQARAELGYVDFLRGRYDRAEHWLTDALEYASGSPSMQAKVMTYLGSVESDRASYRRAVSHLEQAVTLSQAAGSRGGRPTHCPCWAGSACSAAPWTRPPGSSTRRSSWPRMTTGWRSCRGPRRCGVRCSWPGTTRPERPNSFSSAFARACQLGDPCWEGMAARGLALVAEATGDTGRAFALLADARARSGRLAEPYLWLDGYILDAQCDLGRRHGHPDTGAWVETLRNLACRSGMRELTLRSLQHGAALGRAGDGAAAAVLAEELAEYR